MANESGWKDVPEDGYMEATAYVSGAGQQWEQGKHTRQFLEGAIELSMDYVKILEAERDELRSEVRKYKNAATEWMAAYDALAEKYEPRVAVHGEGDE
jgi:Zn-dependent M32 family carboxypeptidase